MANIIQTKRSSVADAVPTTPLAAGELAVNTTDKKLYVGDGSTNHLLVDANEEALPTGVDAQTLRHNGTAWEASSDLTVDADGNIAATANVGGVDITATGNVAAVDVTATGNVQGVDITATGNVGGVDITASGNVAAVDVIATGEVSSDHGVSVGATEIAVPTQAAVSSITTVTQVEYDAIVTPDANTLYVIV